MSELDFVKLGFALMGDGTLRVYSTEERSHEHERFERNRKRHGGTPWACRTFHHIVVSEATKAGAPGVIPRQLEGPFKKFTIARHERERAWVFTCRACGDEYVCSCFPSGDLTPLQIGHLRNHQHSRPEQKS